jgi:hypothetical protein
VSRRILRATLGTPHRVKPEGHGDLWTTTWADDDALYAVADDAHGFRNECDSNLSVHRITGDVPHLKGAVVNCMSEYGAIAELGEDGAHWKANGLTCIDGVLYLFVSRHHLMSTSAFWIQEASDSSIIMSEDHGATWTHMPELGRPMFPGYTFGAPFFVQYERDGTGSADESNEFVYAVSSNGVWNNGSSMTLGRVRRDQIGALDASNWEFIHVFDEGRPVWRPRHDVAGYIFRAPGQTGMTGIHHLGPLGLYVMPQWHYPHLGRPHPDRWQSTRWDLFQAPAPWGPWELFHSQEFSPQGFYNPSVPAKFVSEDGLSFFIFTAGDFATQAHYALHVVPVSLDVEG